jgi:hypothetical protein
VSVADGDLIELRSEGTTSFTVDLGTDDAGTRHRVIRFHAPDAVSPLDAGVSIDSRRLGFGLRTLTLER